MGSAGWTWLAVPRQALYFNFGSVFRMLSRAGESLLQVSNLQDTHPEAARVAAAAAAAVLREPVRSEAAV